MSDKTNWKVDWTVIVNGQDMTTAMTPYLMDIEVSDREGDTGDACSLTLDDTKGQVRLPTQGAAVEVKLQGVRVFTGNVDTVRSKGSRGGGCILSVSAKGFDTRGKAKERMAFHADDATLGDFLKEVAGNAGFSIDVDPQLANISRDYWSADFESFLDVGHRLAREMGATFKLRGTRAVFVKRGGGNDLPVIYGVIGPGGNVINWDIAPFNGRPVFSRSRAHWFDRQEAKFKSVEVEIEPEGPDVANDSGVRAADESQAQGIAEGRKAESDRDAGNGSVELDLTPAAQAEGTFLLSGARPGVDGVYRIAGVKHRANRSGGSTTRLELKQPYAGAGVDRRSSDGSTAVSDTSAAAEASGQQSGTQPTGWNIWGGRSDGRTDAN